MPQPTQLFLRVERPAHQWLRLPAFALPPNQRLYPLSHSEARYVVVQARSLGWITPRPCEVCGNSAAEAHHPDYSKPLKLKWLCRSHHRREHGRLKSEGIVP